MSLRPGRDNARRYRRIGQVSAPGASNMATKRLRPAVIVSTALFALGWAAVTHAQTIIIDPRPIPRPDPRPVMPPPPPIRDATLQVRRHHVDVAIVDGVAETGVDQLFFNPHDRVVEGTYIFPLADDVALGKFSMFVDGKEIEGQLLGVEEARRTYESIVARLRDPALLEYLGSRLFRARIFPINPKSEVRIRLSYTQMLATDSGLVHYRYPLRAEHRSGEVVQTLRLLVNIESAIPIKSVFSPSHAIAVSRPSEHKTTASFEAQNAYPAADFDLYYGLSEQEFGLTVLTHRPSGEDGFFLARIAPPASAGQDDVLPKDIAFVIDTSGSMAGAKMNQAREALRFCLANLNPADRFNIIAFAHEAVRFRDTLVPASSENLEAGRAFADGLRGTGGTNINDAVVAALAAAPAGDHNRPYLIVFLTDGLPTIGVTDAAEILSNVRGRNSERVRLFVFGVGHDVNTHLLDLLAEQNRGARDYVGESEDLELKLSSFYSKVSKPVLADLALSFGGLKVYDTYPPTLGDLFHGSELVVVGRYAGEGPQAIELTGTRRGTAERFVYEKTFPFVQTTHDFLPRLWAMRKVGFLLDQIRLHGENKELKDTIEELAARYGIVTPYTAFLVTEPGPLEGAVARARSRRDRLAPMAGGPSLFGGGAGGERAVADSVAVNSFRSVEAEYAIEAMAAAAPPAKGDQPISGDGLPALSVRRVGTRTFYWTDDRWVDAAYDAARHKPARIEAFSPEYFELTRVHPELAKCLALGTRVLVVVGDQAYDTVPPPGP